MERLEEVPAEKAPARRATRRGKAAGFEFIHLAEGAAEGVGLSSCRIFHNPVLPALGFKESMKAREEQHICQMADFLYARWLTKKHPPELRSSLLIPLLPS
jgi:hypothetical protein